MKHTPRSQTPLAHPRAVQRPRLPEPRRLLRLYLLLRLQPGLRPHAAAAAAAAIAAACRLLLECVAGAPPPVVPPLPPRLLGYACRQGGVRDWNFSFQCTSKEVRGRAQEASPSQPECGRLAGAAVAPTAARIVLIGLRCKHRTTCTASGLRASVQAARMALAWLPSGSAATACAVPQHLQSHWLAWRSAESRPDTPSSSERQELSLRAPSIASGRQRGSETWRASMRCAPRRLGDGGGCSAPSCWPAAPVACSELWTIRHAGQPPGVEGWRSNQPRRPSAAARRSSRGLASADRVASRLCRCGLLAVTQVSRWPATAARLCKPVLPGSPCRALPLPLRCCRAALPAPPPCPRWWPTLCSSCTATSGSATSTRCLSCTGAVRRLDAACAEGGGERGRCPP